MCVCAFVFLCARVLSQLAIDRANRLTNEKTLESKRAKKHISNVL